MCRVRWNLKRGVKVCALFVVISTAFYVISYDAPLVYKLSDNLKAISGERTEPNDPLKAGEEWDKQSIQWKLENLDKNPIFADFIPKDIIEKKETVTILIIVSSGPARYQRRQSIRDTWWNLCKPTGKVKPKCIFITDVQKPGDKYYEIVMEEKEKYNDIEFQNLSGGIEFGIRMISQFVYAFRNFNFDYFLRVDDDYYLCLDRFLAEVPLPPEYNFHWGYTHCDEGIVRPEESMLMLSRDLIQTFLLQSPLTLMCHPWADQMIGMWVSKLGFVRLYRTDPRLFHPGDTHAVKEKLTEKNVCYKYIGIHGAYTSEKSTLWRNHGQLVQRHATGTNATGANATGTNATGTNATVTNLKTNAPYCELSSNNFDVLKIEGQWNYEPKRCIDRPKWASGQPIVNGSFAGRGG